MMTFPRLFAVLLVLFSANAPAQTALSSGQTLYLPVYSHVYHGDVDSKGAPQQTLVSALVSIRNTDLANTIRITSAVYYDTHGKKLREYLPSPVTVPPMENVPPCQALTGPSVTGA